MKALVVLGGAVATLGVEFFYEGLDELEEVDVVGGVLENGNDVLNGVWGGFEGAVVNAVEDGVEKGYV